MIVLIVMLIPILIYGALCICAVAHDADEREEELIRKLLDKMKEQEDENDDNA